MGQEIRHVLGASLWAAEGVHGANRMSNDTSDPLDAEAIKAKLEALKSEHRDLDEVIDRLIEKRAVRPASAAAPEEAQARAEGPDY